MLISNNPKRSSVVHKVETSRAGGIQRSRQNQQTRTKAKVKGTEVRTCPTQMYWGVKAGWKVRDVSGVEIRQEKRFIRNSGYKEK